MFGWEREREKEKALSNGKMMRLEKASMKKGVDGGSQWCD